MELDELQGMIDVKQAARLLKNRSLQTIYRLIERGKLPAVKIVGRLYVRQDDLLALVQPVEPKVPLTARERSPSKAERKAREKWQAEVRARSKI